MGEGLADLAKPILATSAVHADERRRAEHFFRTWIRDEWGRQALFEHAQPGGFLDESALFGHAQDKFEKAFRRHLVHP